MGKTIGFLCTFAAIASMVDSHTNVPLKYKPVEAYEVRSGVLMLPRYTVDGQFCEVELESLHYSSGKVNLDSSLTPEKVVEVFDELVSADEKGEGEPGRSGAVAGEGIVSTLDYQKVLLQSYFIAKRTPSSRIKTEGEPVAVIIWKDRKCK